MSSDPMRDYLEERERVLEARIAELEAENGRLRAALTDTRGSAIVATRKTVAQRLKDIRELAGLTPRQLAQMAGIDEIRYTRIERGEVEPGVELLSKIAEALQCSPKDLLS